MTKEEIERILTYETLKEMYIDQLKTIEEIEHITGVGHTTIGKYLKQYDIPIFSKFERNAKKCSGIKTTDIQQDVINGALLGDGTIAINKNNFFNGYFSYCSTSRQHVEYVYDYLNNLCVSGIRSVEQNVKNPLYSFNTFYHTLFADIWKQWYEWKNTRYYKTNIPNDLKLTPVSCLIWYLGDGGLRTRIKNHNYPQQTLSLATNNFHLECIEDILIPQLIDFDARTEKTANEGQYLITIPRRKIKDFLNYIGDCPFEDYQYKWNYVDYIRTHANDDQIIDLYNQGLTYSKMKEITGCGITTLVTHVRTLKNKGILTGR